MLLIMLQWRIQRGFRGVRLTLPPPPPFLNIPRKCDNLVSVRPNYFIFMGYVSKLRSNHKSEPPLLTHMNHFPEIPFPSLSIFLNTHFSFTFLSICIVTFYLLKLSWTGGTCILSDGVRSLLRPSCADPESFFRGGQTLTFFCCCC